jgi:hypothetical protein
MTDYYGLLRGSSATSNSVLNQIFQWMNDVSPGHPDLKGAGNYVDVWMDDWFNRWIKPLFDQ